MNVSIRCTESNKDLAYTKRMIEVALEMERLKRVSQKPNCTVEYSHVAFLENLNRATEGSGDGDGEHAERKEGNTRNV